MRENGFETLDDAIRRRDVLEVRALDARKASKGATHDRKMQLQRARRIEKKQSNATKCVIPRKNSDSNHNSDYGLRPVFVSGHGFKWRVSLRVRGRRLDSSGCFCTRADAVQERDRIVAGAREESRVVCRGERRDTAESTDMRNIYVRYDRKNVPKYTVTIRSRLEGKTKKTSKTIGTFASVAEAQAARTVAERNCV